MSSGDVRAGRPPGVSAAKIASTCNTVTVPLGDRQQEIAGLRERHLPRLHHDPGTPHRLRVDLARVRQVGPDGVRVYAAAAEFGSFGTAAPGDVVQVQMRSAAATVFAPPTVAVRPPARPGAASTSARPRSRETNSESSTGRTAVIASRCEVAWTPAPNSTRRRASGRARKRVATPLTAAVRSAVRADRSKTASGACEVPSKRT